MQQSYKLKVFKKNDSAFQFYDILFGVYFLEGDPSFYGYGSTAFCLRI